MYVFKERLSCYLLTTRDSSWCRANCTILERGTCIVNKNLYSYTYSSRSKLSSKEETQCKIMIKRVWISAQRERQFGYWVRENHSWETCFLFEIIKWIRIKQNSEFFEFWIKSIFSHSKKKQSRPAEHLRLILKKSSKSFYFYSYKPHGLA